MKILAFAIPGFHGAVGDQDSGLPATDLIARSARSRFRLGLKKTMTDNPANSNTGRAGNSATAHSEAVARVFKRDAEDLLWLAQAILGDNEDARNCIAKARNRAAQGENVAPEWLERWVRRCVARTAVEAARAEIQRFVADAAGHGPIESASASAEAAKALLRSMPAARICKSANAFERTALILHVYLELSAQDSALLAGCHRSLIDPACRRALGRISRTQPDTPGPGADHAVRRSAEAAA